MGLFIDTRKESRVKRLLAKGWKDREISRVVGVARGTIAVIRRGRRRPGPDDEPIRGPRFRKVQTYVCPNGHKVYLKPCVICMALFQRGMPEG